MRKQIFRNNAIAVLAEDVQAQDAIIRVTRTDDLPAIAEDGHYYVATLVERNAKGEETAWEIVRITGQENTALNVARAQEGTQARAWPRGTEMEIRLTAGTLERMDAALPDRVCASTIDYDDRGRADTITETLESGAVRMTQYQYNDDGHVVRVTESMRTDSGGAFAVTATTVYHYDSAGLVVSTETNRE